MKNKILFNLYNSNSQLNSGLKRVDQVYSDLKAAATDFQKLLKSNKDDMLILTAFNTLDDSNRSIIASYSKSGNALFINGILIALLNPNALDIINSKCYI